jgi:uncharacterized membrane protein
MIVTPVLAWRYDSFPALLTALGLLALVRSRAAWAGVWLGLGAVAKIYPIFLLGLFAAYYLAGGERRSLFRLLCAGVTAAALVMAPFRLIAPDQWLSFLAYHQERGFEIESSVAAALWLAHVLDWVPAVVVYNFSAFHISSPIASSFQQWTGPVLMLAVGGTILFYLERFRGEANCTASVRLKTLATATLVVLLVSVIVSKVFSPQYIIWFIPFVALLPWRAVVVFLVIEALTIYVYPFHFRELLDGALVPTLAVNCRNLLVIGLALWLCFSGPQKMVDEGHEEHEGLKPGVGVAATGGGE